MIRIQQDEQDRISFREDNFILIILLILFNFFDDSEI
jgi:hypothetical protein